MNMIRSVLGDVDPATLGLVDYHEHLFQVSPLLLGDELNDEAASGSEARLLRASGFDAMVDATPVGLGRNPEAVAQISASSGLTVIAATGAHRDAHYSADHWLRQLDAGSRAALFLADLHDGMPIRDDQPTRAVTPTGDPVRAGLLKAGIGYWSISPFERQTLEAVALAHAASGAPIMVHLEYCTAAHEVLDLLEGFGVPPQRVVLAHADRDPNPALHLELVARGAWLGYDGIARPRTRSDAELLTLTEAVVAGGGLNRLLIGGDVARRRRYVSYGGMPGLAYLGNRYLPALRARIGNEQVERILRTNAAQFLTSTPA